MSNMLDYIVWRGDLPLDRDGWNDVDALVMACFCYGTLTEALDKPLTVTAVAERMNWTESQLVDFVAVAGKAVAGSAADYAAMRDAGEVSGYARPAVGWCFRNGIISGMGGNLVVPQGTATRAQAAVIFSKLAALLG